MSVELLNESGLAVDEHRLLAVARHALGTLGVHPLAELSVRLVDVDAMTALHEHWMDEPGPTDVMAFPMDELDPPRGDDDDLPPTLLGDVVLCPQVAQAQAPAGQSMQDELEMLCVHGVLHLLGYDHAEAEEQREMFGTQDRVLRAWRAGGTAG